jgi:hypothetical protein
MIDVAGLARKVTLVTGTALAVAVDAGYTSR